MRTPSRVLVDTNAIIEAVRTGCWAAITGVLRVEAVEECRFEASSGSPGSVPGYVPVGPKELDRLSRVLRFRDPASTSVPSASARRTISARTAS